MSVASRADRIIQAGINCARTRQGSYRCEEITLCTEGYAEPGYDGEVIAFGNWNRISRYIPQHVEQFRFPKHKNRRISKKWAKRPENCRLVESHFQTLDDTPCRVASLLEKAGVEIEWSDEWTTCSDCGKALRTSPDSYGWQPSYTADDDGDYFCEDCTDWPAYCEELEGNPRKAITNGLDLEQYGYKLLESGFENGWHPGQDADPTVIGEALLKLGVTRFLFKIDSTGQFDMDFSVWVHESEVVDTEKWANAAKNGPSNSEGLRRALQAASNPPRPESGIVVTKLNAQKGTATHKIVSPEDFVNGKALEE